MDTIKQIVLQESNEARYSRKHIDAYLRTAITESPLMQTKVLQGVELITEYLTKNYYESKNTRLAQLKDLDLSVLVMDIFVGVCYCQTEELFTSVTAKMAGRLRLSDRTAAITTVAELMAVLCATDAFDILKSSKMASLVVLSRVPLTTKLLSYIEHSTYLPPMVCSPLELTNNYSSGYLGHNDSLVLGSGNHHDGSLCLDVLNVVNKVAFKLDLDFLSQVEELPTFDLDTQIKQEQWANFKKQSYSFYSLMASQGNQFYFTNRVDKRGRIYSQGFHLNPQGPSFKKAMLELAKEEVVTGMP